MTFVKVSTPRDQVALITLDRAERMNAMAFDVMIPFREALEKVSRDNEVRVVVVTGAGHGFCSGADHEDAGMVPDIDGLTVPTIAMRAMELLDDVIHAIRKMHQPVIAAVNGAAAGGGLGLALAADIRIASPAARVNAAFVRIGLSAGDVGVSWSLPRVVGLGRAAEIMLTGRFVDAEEAAAIGLVNRVVPADKLLDEAFAIADQIAANTPFGVTLTKRVLNTNVDAGSLTQAVEVENRGQTLTTRGNDFREALAAFREKRPANLTAR